MKSVDFFFKHCCRVSMHRLFALRDHSFRERRCIVSLVCGKISGHPFQGESSREREKCRNELQRACG